jgi:hypothetical protein
MAKRRHDPPKPRRAIPKPDPERDDDPGIRYAKDIASRLRGGSRDDAEREVKLWAKRLLKGTKDYDAWAKEYDVKYLEKYYLGKHWKGLTEIEAAKKYVINLVFATVETQLPSLLFSKPTVEVEPRPDHEQTSPESDAPGRATLIQQMLQTYVDDPELHFGFLTTLALRDAYPRFALMEVGYTADYIDNPNVGKPILDERENPLVASDDQPVLQPKKIRKPGSKESLYLKRVAPQAFRCSPGRNLLEHNDWNAYYEWQYVSDVQQNKDYTGTEDLKGTGRLANTAEEETHDRDPDKERDLEGQVKIWKIWDMRAMERITLAEGHKTVLQRKAFTYLPLAALKFFEIADSFYPLPPIYNWISPQDEINESREMAKIHRRRAVRRYMRESSVDPKEIEKLETGEDMTVIEVAKCEPAPIVAIQDAELGQATMWTNLAATHDDYNQITGVSGEARGMPEADTATQANIINQRAQVRESRARVQVAEWLAGIVRLMLLTVREHMQLPIMVKRMADPWAPPGPEQQETAEEWQAIEAESVDELDVDIKIDVASLSPVAEDQQRQWWGIILQIFTNPATASLLMEPDPLAPQAPSPLFRETLNLYGMKSERKVRTMWRIGQALQAKMTAAAQAAATKDQKPQPMTLSLALKGDDFANPQLGPLLYLILQREEGIAAQTAPAHPAVPTSGAPADGGKGLTAMPAAPGPTTGTPTAAPGAGGA